VEWCLAWHNVPQLCGHHTNNYAEITVRLFKDNVLTQCKAYNVLAIVDFVVTLMECFYRNRLESLTVADHAKAAAAAVAVAASKTVDVGVADERYQCGEMSEVVTVDEGGNGGNVSGQHNVNGKTVNQ